ncbi:MAG TPA: hypothetical protein PLB73_09890, partial [Leptospiraceae bacterium]|nr:hypothetical protein [Leptospiraceae bacterium]
MTRLLPITSIFFFVYYLSFITGRPGLEQPEKYEDAKNTSSFKVAFKPGLIERALIQKKAIGLEDDLLESDAQPERLFRSLERSYAGDLFSSAAITLWCTGFLLCFLALRKRVWFGRSMAWLLILPSTVSILIVLFTLRRAGLTGVIVSYDSLAISYVETALVLIGSASLMRSGISNRDADRPFLNHLEGKDSDWADSFKRVPRAFLEIIAISAASAALANFVVLPAYYLQISFPRFFATLLGLALAGLAAFYIRAYLKVARMQNPDVSASTAAAFLGFRILANSL